MSIKRDLTRDEVVAFFGCQAYQRRFLIEKLEDGLADLGTMTIPIIDWRSEGYIPIRKDSEVGFLFDAVRSEILKESPNAKCLDMIIRDRVYGVNASELCEREIAQDEVAEQEALLKFYWDELMVKDVDPVLIGIGETNRRIQEELERRKQWMK